MKEDQYLFAAGSSAGSTLLPARLPGPWGTCRRFTATLGRLTHLRMKAAIEALPYERPRLAVTAVDQRTGLCHDA